jgi:MtrB/PioB family decaheme-associated outer membrane protein
MRRIAAGWVATLLLAASAAADTDLGPATASGWLEGGVRGISGDEASAKYDWYRDVSIGAFGAGSLLLQDSEHRNYLQLGGYDLGEHDADYFLEGGRWGHWGIQGNFSLLPHDYSGRALTPYLGMDSGNLFLPFAPPTDSASFETSVIDAAHSARLHFQTKDWGVRAFVKPTSEWELESGYRETDRNGRRADQISYGFSNFAHFAEEIDEKVQEVTGDARLVKETYSADLRYTGSFFNNDFNTFILQNPAPFAGGSPLGAIAAAPDNSSHLLSLTGSTLLSPEYASRISGTVAYGLRFQNQAFIPITVNPGLTSPALPAHDLDGKVQTFFANLLFNARPLPQLDVTARYRVYDYDNDTPELTFNQVATTDASLSTTSVTSFAPSFVTQNAYVDGTYRVTDPLRVTLGLAWNRWDRGPEREVQHSDDWSPKLGLDYRAGLWGRFQTTYAYSWRNGDGYDELAPFRAIEPGVPRAPLTPPIKKFSQADNQRQALHVLSQLFLREDTDVSLNGDFHFTRYTEGKYGLNNDNQFDLGIEVTHRLFEGLEITASYSYDWIQLRQTSASSSGTLDWESQSLDRAHTAGVTVSWAAVPDRLTLDGGYFLQVAQGQTRTHGAPADAVNYPNVDNNLWALFTSASYRLDDHWTFVARYRYEHYTQKDWQFDDLGVTTLTSTVEGQPLLGTNSDVFLRNGLPGYHVSFVSVSAVLSF